MGFMARALAGAGDFAVNLSNKYIDEELAQNRAAALAELQVKTAATIRADADAFNSDPARVARERANKVADITAEGNARADIDFASRKRLATDPELMAADVKRAGEIAGATATATTNAQYAAELKQITNPQWLDAKRKLALATHVESAGSIAQAALANFQLSTAKEVSVLSHQLAEAQSSGNKDAADDIQAQIDAITGKGGKVDKFYAQADAALKSKAGALKILNDPMATQDAKDEANASIRQADALLEGAAKRAGLTTISDAKKEPEASVHAKAQAAIKAGAPLDAINERLKAAGYNPLPGAAPKKSLMQSAQDAVGYSGPGSTVGTGGSADMTNKGLIELTNIINSPSNPPALQQAARDELARRRQYTPPAAARTPTVSEGD